MKTIHLRSRVGPDGILDVRVPTGMADSELDVLIVVDAAAQQAPSDWSEFVRTTAGSIVDPSFARHEQGEYESRETLP
jgi:hypothetical protein